LWILSLAVVSTLLGYSLYTRGLKYLEAGRAGIACTWEVVVASILAFMIFGETLSAPQIVGACLIFVGIFLVRIHPPDKTRKAAPVLRG
jgi:drug/metabolite transporter (DMT)-like permease